MRTFSTAYLLVSHGSRDPRSQHSAQALAALIAERLLCAARSLPAIASDIASDIAFDSMDGGGESPYSGVNAVLAPAHQSLLIDTAVLELGEYPLHQQIAMFAERAIAQGCKQLKILPLFLLAGVHVMEDIPAEVAIAQQQIGDRLPVQLQPHLGSHPDLITLLAQRVGESNLANATKIVMSHGSQRAGANHPVEAIARHLGGIAAYWSMPPGLEAQVTALINSGQTAIAIVPYFLFPGGITDAIATRVQALAQQFPSAQMRLIEPLGATPQLADVTIKLLDL